MGHSLNTWPIWLILGIIFLVSIYGAWRILPRTFEDVYGFGSKTLHYLTFIAVALGIFIAISIVFLAPFDLVVNGLKISPPDFLHVSRSDFSELWTPVYWSCQVCSQLSSWLFLFRRSGFLTTTTRIADISKQYLKVRIFAAVFAVIFLIIYLSETKQSSSTAGAVLLSFFKSLLNAVGLAFLLFFLGQGLVQVPRNWFWGTPSNKKFACENNVYRAEKYLEIKTDQWRTEYKNAVSIRDVMAPCLFRELFDDLIENTNKSATMLVSGEVNRRQHESIRLRESQEANKWSFSFTIGKRSGNNIRPSSTTENSSGIDPENGTRGISQKKKWKGFKRSKKHSNTNYPEMESLLANQDSHSQSSIGSTLLDANENYDNPAYTSQGQESHFLTQSQKSVINSKEFTKEHKELAKARQSLHWITVDMDQAHSRLIDSQIQAEIIESSSYNMLLVKCIFYSFLAILMGIFSLIVIWTESVGLIALNSKIPKLNFFSIFFNDIIPKLSFWVAFLITLLSVTYITYCSLISLIHSRSKFLHLYPVKFHHDSEATSILKLNGFLLLIINPLVFNFVLLIGSPHDTAMQDFYGDISIVPVLGNVFSVYLPIFLIIIVLATITQSWWSRLFKSSEALSFQDSLSSSSNHDPAYKKWKKVNDKQHGQSTEERKNSIKQSLDLVRTDTEAGTTGASAHVSSGGSSGLKGKFQAVKRKAKKITSHDTNTNAASGSRLAEDNNSHEPLESSAADISVPPPESELRNFQVTSYGTKSNPIQKSVECAFWITEEVLCWKQIKRDTFNSIPLEALSLVQIGVHLNKDALLIFFKPGNPLSRMILVPTIPKERPQISKFKKRLKIGSNSTTSNTNPQLEDNTPPTQPNISPDHILHEWEMILTSLIT